MEDFEELRHLGRGAFGEVLLMRQTSTGLLCAVKKLGKTALPAGEEAEHLAEVKVLQTLEHPCILRYYGSIQLDESLSLVMEFADSGDLQQLLKKQMDSEKLFEAAALFAIFSQLVVAVAHVHARRVLHRDLKPSNVMLTSSGLLKLGDFGVAKVMAGTTVVDNMTCVGSPTYMAPEIVAGEAYGAPCDVWSLGVILYELASFKRPFEGRSLGELIMRISSGKFESIGAHLADNERTVSPFSLVLASELQLGKRREPELQAQTALAAVCRLVAMALGPITTHALNTATGRPAENLQVTLKQAQSGDEDGQIDWKLLKVARTKSDGRAESLGEGLGRLSPGEVFELSFATSEYFKEQGTPCFYPVVRIAFEIQEAESHYHVPLLISPFGYSTYRGPGGHVLEDAVAPVLAKMLVVDPKGRGRITEVVRSSSVQTFVASLKTSAVIVASIIQELEDPHKPKGIDVNTAAIDELIAELAAKSPKRAEAAENLPKGAGQVRSSLAAKVGKQVVEDDSLALSLTSSNLGTAVLSAKHHGQNSSGEVSFNLTATDALHVSKKVPVPVLNEDTHEAVKAVSQKFGQRSGGHGVSHDNHALRDVLGDALELGGTSRTEQGTAKSDALARSGSNTSRQMRSTLPMQGTRDLAEAVLRDAMGPEVSTRSGPLQTSGTVVAEGEAGSVHFEHVTPGWKVKSSSHGGAMLVSSRANLIFLRHAARAAATSSSLPVPHAEKVDGVTYVSDAASASKALSVLKRCSDKVVAWDTETTGVDLRFGLLHSDRGRVVCVTAYCGDDVDFGNGPLT
eukprot:s955_g2.t2